MHSGRSRGSEGDGAIELMHLEEKDQEGDSDDEDGFRRAAAESPGSGSTKLIRNLPPEVAVTEINSESRKMSIPGGAFSLANTIFGGGILTLPYALKITGAVPGSIALFIIALIQCSSLVLVVESGRICNASSYEEAGFKTFGKKGKGAAITLLSLSGSTAVIGYIITLGDLLCPMLQHQIGEDAFIAQRWPLTVLLVSTTALPLCCLPRLQNFQSGSIFSVLLVMGFGGIVLYRYFIPFSPVEDPVVVPTTPGSPWDFFMAIPLFVFSFASISAAYPLHNDLIRPTPKRYACMTFTGVLGTSVIYFVVGIVGLMTFGEKTQTNLLKNYDSQDVVANIIRLGISATLILTIPMQHFGSRRSIDILLFPDSPPTNRRLACESVLIIGVATVIALAFPVLLSIFGFCGAAMLVFADYVLPACMYVKNTRGTAAPMLFRISASLLILLGIPVGVIGTYTYVRDYIDNHMN